MAHVARPSNHLAPGLSELACSAPARSEQAADLTLEVGQLADHIRADTREKQQHVSDEVDAAEQGLTKKVEDGTMKIEEDVFGTTRARSPLSDYYVVRRWIP